MTQNKKKTAFSFRLENGIGEKFDRRISRMGYTSRSEFFSAVVCATMQGAEKESSDEQYLPEETGEWLEPHLPDQAEEDIRTQLFSIIRETILPVIAIRGTDIAFQNTWQDIRSIMHEQTGIWATESELKDAYRQFTLLHKPELTLYKNNQLATGENL